MTVDEVQKEVATISNLDDDEGQHYLEDQLYHRIVRELASVEGKPNFTFFDLSELVLCAKEAIKTEDMAFDRWYA